MPDFFGRMVGLMNIEANTNLMNQQAQDINLLAQQRAQAIGIQNRMQEQILNAMTADETTLRQGLTEGVSSTAKQSVGYDENNPLINVVNTLQGQMGRVAQRRQWALRAGDIQEVDKADQAFNATMTNYREAQTALMKDIEEKTKEASNVLGGVHDQTSQDAALSHIANNIGKAAAKKIMQALPADAIGRPVYDSELTPKALAPFIDQYKTGHEQATEKNMQAMRQAQTTAQGALADYRKEQVKHMHNIDANAALNRHRLEAKDAKEHKDLTTSQQRTNDEIDQAREELLTLNDEQLAPYFNPMTEQSLLNPRVIKLIDQAGKKKYGDDPNYKNVSKMYSAVHYAERQGISSKDLPNDPAVKEYESKHSGSKVTLGTKTPKGWELLDGDKVVGYWSK